MQVRIQQLAPGMVQQIQSVCSECSGQGERINPKDRCKNCQGRKVTRERKILEVHIDKGMRDGQQIRFSGEGDQEPNLEPGDVIIVLDEEKHAVFERHGTDLAVRQELSLAEALCGCQRTLNTLDKRVLVYSTLPGRELCTHDTGVERSQFMFFLIVYFGLANTNVGVAHNKKLIKLQVWIKVQDGSFTSLSETW